MQAQKRLLIGIDGTSISNLRGYGRFARGLVHALLKVNSNYDFLIFIDQQSVDSAFLPDNAPLEVISTSEAPSEAAADNSSRSLSDIWQLSRTISLQNPDYMFFPSVYTYFPMLTRTHVILGIHDAIASKYESLLFENPKDRLFWNLKNFVARQQARTFMTVSDYARQSIIERYKIPAQKLYVVGEAPDPVFKPQAAEIYAPVFQEFGLNDDTPYFICLGGLNPHKNIPHLIEAFAQINTQYPDLRLVLVGPVMEDNFSPGIAKVQQAIEEHQLTNKVIFTGYIPDEQVVSLLNGAAALIMPSLEEGYGLGAVEAAACGTPVIATQNSPLPQILAGGGIFIDPTNLEQLVAAMQDMLTAQAADYGRVAQEKAEALSWDKSAQQFLAMVEQTR